MIAIAVIALCAGAPVASAQVAVSPSPTAVSPVFTPRFIPSTPLPPPFLKATKPDPRAVAARKHAPRARPRHTAEASVRHGAEVVCGTKMFRPSTDVDAGIRIETDLGKGITARRIEPHCGPASK